MNGSHNNILSSANTGPFSSGDNGQADAYPLPDPFEVARLLGNKGEGLDRVFRQGLMSEILDNAPQRPSRKSRFRFVRS